MAADILLSFEFFARRDDLWGSPLGCGRPLRPACPRAGICEGCEHAGLGGRRSPRGCPTNRRGAQRTQNLVVHSGKPQTAMWKSSQRAMKTMDSSTSNYRQPTRMFFATVYYGW